MQGRWPSPDPSGLAAVNPNNPQSWNGYAYVLNNPLELLDPNGLDCAYFKDDGSVDHIDIGDCDSDDDNGYYIDATGVTGASIDIDTGELTGYSIGNQLYNPDGSTFDADFIGYGSSAVAGDSVDAEISPFGLGLIQQTAQDTASLPWLCNTSVSVRAKIPKTPISIGLTADRDGIGPSSKLSSTGEYGGVALTTNGKVVGYQVIAPVTPIWDVTYSQARNQFTVGVSKKYDFGPGKVSVSGSLTFGYLGDSTCRK
jgi:hypothetical protein